MGSTIIYSVYKDGKYIGEYLGEDIRKDLSMSRASFLPGSKRREDHPRPLPHHPFGYDPLQGQSSAHGI